MNPSDKRTILFTLIFKHEHYPVQTARYEYHPLMTLIADYLGTDGFGRWSGIGSCGTSMVIICSQKVLLSVL